MEWLLILQLELITPHKGDAIVQSEFIFPTFESCEKHKTDISPRVDSMIKGLFGPLSTYKNATLTCKENLTGEPI